MGNLTVSILALFKFYIVNIVINNLCIIHFDDVHLILFFK